MKPVRRRIKRHFGLTAKQVAVRSRRPWYFQWLATAAFIFAGYALAYWQYAVDGKSLSAKLNQANSANQDLQSKLIQVERQLQIEQIAQRDLTQQLNQIQDESLHLKEDLLFYKNMVSANRHSKR